MSYCITIVVPSFVGYKLSIMEDVDYIYSDDTVSIREDVLNKDFDEVGFDLVEVDDSDDDAAEMFDY